MTLPAILFGISALGGLVMAAMRLRGAERPPLALALLHGALAAGGLVALLMAVMAATPTQGARAALGLLVIAALGGFVLFSFHLRGKALPVGLMLIHGGVAAAGFVTLLLTLGG
jgi:hypothetical protein